MPCAPPGLTPDAVSKNLHPSHFFSTEIKLAFTLKKIKNKYNVYDSHPQRENDPVFT